MTKRSHETWLLLVIDNQRIISPIEVASPDHVASHCPLIGWEGNFLANQIEHLLGTGE